MTAPLDPLPLEFRQDRLPSPRRRVHALSGATGNGDTAAESQESMAGGSQSISLTEQHRVPSPAEAQAPGISRQVRKPRKSVPMRGQAQPRNFENDLNSHCLESARGLNGSTVSTDSSEVLSCFDSRRFS